MSWWDGVDPGDVQFQQDGEALQREMDESESDCGSPCPAESACEECSEYWERMRAEGLWRGRHGLDECRFPGVYEVKNRLQHRVTWKREGLRPKSRIVANRETAERLKVKLTAGPEGYLAALRVDPDAPICCSGSDCGCYGKTWREADEEFRAEAPPVEYVRIETRIVSPWLPEESACEDCGRPWDVDGGCNPFGCEIALLKARVIELKACINKLEPLFLVEAIAERAIEVARLAARRRDIGGGCEDQGSTPEEGHPLRCDQDPSVDPDDYCLKCAARAEVRPLLKAARRRLLSAIRKYENRPVTDCRGDGCAECDVCRYHEWQDWVAAVAPGVPHRIQSDPRMEAYLAEREVKP